MFGIGNRFPKFFKRFIHLRERKGAFAHPHVHVGGQRDRETQADSTWSEESHTGICPTTLRS